MRVCNWQYIWSLYGIPSSSWQKMRGHLFILSSARSSATYKLEFRYTVWRWLVHSRLSHDSRIINIRATGDAYMHIKLYMNLKGICMILWRPRSSHLPKRLFRFIFRSVFTNYASFSRSLITYICILHSTVRITKNYLSIYKYMRSNESLNREGILQLHSRRRCHGKGRKGNKASSANVCCVLA